MNLKTILIILLLGLTAAVAGKIIADRKFTPPPMLALPENKPAKNSDPPPVAAPANKLPPVSQTVPAPPDVKPDPAVTAVANAIDTLTSPQTSFGERRALLEQLRKAGEIDEVIAGLKELAADNPGDALTPIALGEAELAKIRSVLEAGGDKSDIPILGMQADQNFNQALKIDPTSWEAQFEKAAAMAHWPPGLDKGPEVIERLSSLVTQQETMPSKPEFVRTYILLGQQYQAAGQTDQAIHTWQQGAAKFPSNPTLQKYLARATAQ
jgi:tetratricopeptide (TPR) repeat protein